MTINATVLPLTQVKARLSEYVARVHDHHERVLLTRNGEAAAMLISPDDLEGMEMTLEILADPEAVARIRQAEAEVAAGNIVTAQEMAELMEARRRREAHA